MNKRFLSVAASTAIMASAIVFTGCGDSSSSSSVTPTGALSGQFVKGLWKGINYTTNSSISGSTNATGHFTFKAGDYVTLDLGLIKANITAPTSGVVAGITDSAVVNFAYANNTAVAAADRANVQTNFLTAVLAAKGNVTDAEVAGQDVSSMITGFKSIVGTTGNSLDLNKAAAAFQANLDTRATTAGVTLKATPTVAAGLVADLTTSIAKQMVAASIAGNEYTGASLNATKLKNIAIVFTDGSALNLSNGVASLNSSNMSNEATTAGALSSWNATGGRIVLGGTNTSNSSLATVVFKGALGAGAVVKYVATTGNITTKTVDKVYANLYKFGMPGYKYNLTFAMGSTSFALNTTGGADALPGLTANLTIAGGTSYLSNGTGTGSTANSTVSGTYNQTLVLNFNGTGGAQDNQTNLTFNLDPTEAGNQGILSSITMTISSLMTTIATYISNGAAKVLSAMGLGQ
jgi:hypothetical protein